MFFYQHQLWTQRSHLVCLAVLCWLLASCATSGSNQPPEAIVYDDTV